VQSVAGRAATTAARLLYRQFVENRTKGYKLAGVENGQSTTVGLKDAKDVRPPWQWEHIIVVNPQKGWRDLIHRLSHKFHARLHSNAKEHDERHADLEAEMASWVVSPMAGLMANCADGQSEPNAQKAQITGDGTASSAGTTKSKGMKERKGTE
jgi:hypothetical protein